MFNTFVTGFRQPPVGFDVPWIHLIVTESIHLDSLPLPTIRILTLFERNSSISFIT